MKDEKNWNKGDILINSFMAHRWTTEDFNNEIERIKNANLPFKCSENPNSFYGYSFGKNDIIENEEERKIAIDLFEDMAINCCVGYELLVNVPITDRYGNILNFYYHFENIGECDIEYLKTKDSWFCLKESLRNWGVDND